MKYTACFVCLLLATHFLFGQNAPLRTEKGLIFSVSKVKKAAKPLATVSYKTALENILPHKVEAFPLQKTTQKLVPTQAHGFMKALHFAYADHRPLVISPDMIWTLIAQGVAIHINQNSQKLLPKMVAHEGKKNIRIQTDSSFRKGKNNPWQEVFGAFADSVQRGIRPEFYALMVPQFSTSSPLETTVYQVIVMDAFQKSFGLVGATGCGIPEITLEGTVADWEQIRARLDTLQSYEGLEDWAKGLMPILDNFIAAAKGNPDGWFWEQMYKSVEYYTVDYISGWSLKFFPYIKHETRTNKVSKTNPDEHITVIGYKPNPFCTGEKYHFSNIGLEDLPAGLSNCPFSWEIYPNKFSAPKIHPMRVYAGFVGFAQDETTKALRPELAWAVVDEKNTPKSKPVKSPNIASKIRSDYWSPLQILKPDILPIFAPEKAKTYAAGLRFLDEYLAEKIAQHPQKEALKGRVRVRFVVTWSGKIADVVIKTSANPTSDAVAKTSIENLPLWSPARFKNKDAMNTDSIKDLFCVNYPCSVWVDFGEDPKQSVKKE